MEDLEFSNKMLDTYEMPRDVKYNTIFLYSPTNNKDESINGIILSIDLQRSL